MTKDNPDKLCNSCKKLEININGGLHSLTSFGIMVKCEHHDDHAGTDELLDEYDVLFDEYMQVGEDSPLRHDIIEKMELLEYLLRGTKHVCKYCGEVILKTKENKRISYNGYCAYCKYIRNKS